jgi:competence protein ComEC
LFALALGIYLIAPRPILAFDQDLRAVFARTNEAPAWTLMARPGRSSYARERLGAMLGLSPRQVERLPAPRSCAEAGCTWLSPGGRAMTLVADSAGNAPACDSAAIVLASFPAPTLACAAMVIDASNLAREGGGFVYETERGLRIERVGAASSRRPWTPRVQAQE